MSLEYEYVATRQHVDRIRDASKVPRPKGEGWVIVDSCCYGTSVIWTWRRDANPPSSPSDATPGRGPS
jgi:hypothetical protein